VRWAALVARALLTSFTLAATAQTAETSLRGEVFDELGGPVIAARASVTAADGHLYLTRTTERGGFLFLRLQAGNYTLDLEQAGFCAIRVEKIVVQQGERKALPRLSMVALPVSGMCP